MCLINKNVLKMIKYFEYGSQFGSSFTLGARIFFYRKSYCIRNLGCSAGLSLKLSLVLKSFRLKSQNFVLCIIGDGFFLQITGFLNLALFRSVV